MKTADAAAPADKMMDPMYWDENKRKRKETARAEQDNNANAKGEMEKKRNSRYPVYARCCTYLQCKDCNADGANESGAVA